MRYFDLKRNWRRVRRHIANSVVQEVLVRDFNKFTFGRWGKEFKPGMVPSAFESCDWLCEQRRYAFHQYTKHAACHWLVNFNLELAQIVEPERPWRIMSSDLHSTVWDGADLLLDFNFLAAGIPPEETFQMAAKGKGARALRPGQHLMVHLAEHWSLERRG